MKRSLGQRRAAIHNEELQTAKEEAQSANEELATVNDELRHRNAELGRVNNDLINLLSGVNFPIVMVSRDLRIRRFTPLAERIFNLIPSDVGRPISDIKPNLDVPDLGALIGRSDRRTHAVRGRDPRSEWPLLLFACTAIRYNRQQDRRSVDRASRYRRLPAAEQISRFKRLSTAA